MFADSYIDPGSVLQVGGQKEGVVGVSGLNPIIIMFSWVAFPIGFDWLIGMGGGGG